MLAKILLAFMIAAGLVLFGTCIVLHFKNPAVEHISALSSSGIEKPDNSISLSTQKGTSTPAVPKPTHKIIVPKTIPTIEPIISTSAPKQVSNDELYTAYSPVVLNVWCEGRDTVTSGTATIIDPSGILLTNAHVVKDIQNTDECVLRTEEHNIAKFKILYIPSQDELIPGTEYSRNDFAFLKITQGLYEQGPIWPSAHIEFTVPQPNERLSVFGYSTEFVGYLLAVRGIPLLFSNLTVEKPLTFDETLNTADIILLRGGISAQGGSSGSPLVNNNKNIVGLFSLVTKSGTTTADRKGIALLTGYIDRELQKERGQTLRQFLDANK